MPDRIQLRRTRGWKLPENAIKVSRPSHYGNPWRVKESNTGRTWTVYDGHGNEWVYGNEEAAHDGAVTIYRRWLTQNQHPGRSRWPVEALQKLAEQREHILATLDELRGRDLACWCRAGLACHSSVLIELANRGGSR